MISDYELRDDMLVSSSDKKEPIKKYYEINEKIYNQVDYYIAIGKRSNGKTTKGLKKALEIHINSGYKYCGAYIRRWALDFKGNTAKTLWDGVINLGWIEKFTKGEYNGVFYKSERWYLVHYNEEGKIDNQCDNPVMIAFNIAGSDHYKSNAYPFVKLIIFDEFMTRDYYLPDEFILFQNLLSTIIRDRTDVKILMFANTVNKYCPYFNEMGLKGVKNQKQGTIDIYNYANTDLQVALEYCEDNTKGKAKVNKYFAFDNPKLQMIQTGAWEISIYPHLPCKYTPSEVCYKFFIEFDGDTIQCNVVDSKELKTPFIFCHRKTTPIKDDDKESLIYTRRDVPSFQYRKYINKPFDNVSKKIWFYFANDKVFYQSNDIGEVVRNYIVWCNKESLA